LSILQDGTKKISKFLKPGDIVVYESTVYPGCTEEFCIPLLENGSKLKCNKDFFCGYSPERVNPGDKHHQIENIVKIVSGSNSKVCKLIDKLYSTIIKAGTLSVSSIKVAEAAKVIENTQRDLNIAFILILKKY
jgi:UDP-N-acetyl-D-galactosamine dehydrogenase